MKVIKMPSKRIERHPILTIPDKVEIEFDWNGMRLTGFKDEMISSALFANNIHIFGHHHKDASPQGVFCANGQCSQCMVVANEIAVKSCMTKLKPNMSIRPMEGLPVANNHPTSYVYRDIKKHNIPVLIIGGGPAGLSAAIELGKFNIKTILLDDKDRLGGKLVLQTHKFFGSIDDSYAGTRGFEIGNILEKQLRTFNSVNIWLNSTAIGIFSDGVVGCIRNETYEAIKPENILVATGAREKMLSFPGNTLPGVYGAGAFQTLVNRDLVKPSNKVLIVGGGNVGLIAGYHAIQAGIKVIGLVEALPSTGGYKVHSDKLMRMGVPIFTQHTVVSAQGNTHVNGATIAELDDNWQIKPNSYKTFEIDTILVAVGLTKVDEFYFKAKQWGMNVYTAGDAEEISEASAAMFTGKIEGRKIAKALNLHKEKIPEEWTKKVATLKSKPSKLVNREITDIENGVFPVFHCYQEVPCNPCTSICPENAIKTVENKITGLPYIVDMNLCKGCMACVAICPGLAITLVDYRKNSEKPTVTVPYEMWKKTVIKGSMVPVTDIEGTLLGQYEVKRTITNEKKHSGTTLVQIQADNTVSKKIVGIQTQSKQYDPTTIIHKNTSLPDEAILCRCERVTIGEIRETIRNGITDLNQIKAITRIGMGACGSKTCRPLVWKIFQEEKIHPKEITDRVDRPLFVEVPMGTLAGIRGNDNDA